MNEPWSEAFEYSVSPWFGYVSTYSAAEEIIKCFQVSTNTRYVVYYRKNGVSDEIDAPIVDGHCIRFEDRKDHNCKFTFQMESDNVPFICKNIDIRDCHRGVNHYQAKPFSEMDYKTVKRKSKKQGCTARIVIREILRFPDFQAEKNTETFRKKASRQLRQALKESPVSVGYERRIYISLPQLAEHNHDNGITEDGQINEIVVDGIDPTNEIQLYLQEFVNSSEVECFKDKTQPLSPFILITNHECSSQPRHDNIEENIQSNETNKNSNNLEKEESLTAYATKCRASLKELTNITYIIDDKEILMKLNEKIQELQDWASAFSRGDSVSKGVNKKSVKRSFSLSCNKLPNRKRKTVA